MGDARTEVGTVGPDRFEGARHGGQQFVKVVCLTVRESLLGQFPDSLVRVELGSISGESVQMNPPGAGAELADELAAVRIPSVPQHENVTADLAE